VGREGERQAVNQGRSRVLGFRRRRRRTSQRKNEEYRLVGNKVFSRKTFCLSGHSSPRKILEPGPREARHKTCILHVNHPGVREGGDGRSMLGRSGKRVFP